jgi:hypothetical protein
MNIQRRREELEALLEKYQDEWERTGSERVGRNIDMVEAELTYLDMGERDPEAYGLARY